MGLDMYLTKKTFVGAEYEHRNVKGTVEITVDGEPLPITFNRISEITENVAYWRKANAIHKWFVDNCQDGIDECQDTYVEKESLEELLDLCKQVKKDNKLAPALLPATSGFFFGGTDYDEWYFDAINHTIKAISALLAEDISQASIYYHSSW
jgi:hypothetical protein